MRLGDRGDRRAHGLEAGALRTHRAAPERPCAGGEQHLGPVDHPARRGAARSDQAALLRHSLLQPAALHGAGGIDRHARHRAARGGRAGELRHHLSWQERGARQGHAQFHCQPRGHRRHARHHEGGANLRPRLRRRRRPHRQEARPRQLGHLSHRRRGGPGHDGARDQDAAGHADGRPVLPHLRDAAGAERLARSRRAGTKKRCGFLQESRQRHPSARPRTAGLRASRRQGR